MIFNIFDTVIVNMSNSGSNNGTTNIDDLPVSNQVDVNANANANMNANANIKLHVQEKNVVIDNPIKTATVEREKDTIDINKFITGIQQASASGLLALPSRDIPQNQQHITQDHQIQANYVPKGPDDYIKEHQTPEDIIQKNAQRETNANSLDEYYNELHIPIMIAVLYFLFHLPVVRKNMFRYIPFLFAKDGNLNGTGYVAHSILFAGLCYGIFKSINYMSV
jgi:hypothetical protein